MGAIALDKEATAAQIALAWLLEQKPWIVPIPGTTKSHRLQENSSSTSVKLDASDLAKINEALERIDIQGARYPEQMQKLVNK